MDQLLAAGILLTTIISGIIMPWLLVHSQQRRRQMERIEGNLVKFDQRIEAHELDDTRVQKKIFKRLRRQGKQLDTISHIVTHRLMLRDKEREREDA